MSSRDQAAAAMVGRIAMAFDGALLGLTLAVASAQTISKYRFTSRALSLVRAAPSVPISDLRSVISEDDQKVVVVRGVVREKSPEAGDAVALVSHGSGERAVVVQRTQMCLYNETGGIFGWSVDLHALFRRSRRDQYSYSCRSVPFLLIENGTPGAVNVKLDGSTQHLPLTTVFHQLMPIQAFSSSFLQALFGCGYPVAILDEEKILPVGKEITAIGICKIQGGTPEIKSSDELPCFLSDLRKDEVEAELSLNSDILFWSGILLGSLSIGILGFAAVRNWWRWRVWRHGRHPDQESSQIDIEEIDIDEEDDNGDVPDGQLCVVCLTRRRRSAFNPCGHLVCCPRCALMVERDSSPKCPLCRQSIRSSIRIYAS